MSVSMPTPLLVLGNRLQTAGSLLRVADLVLIGTLAILTVFSLHRGFDAAAMLTSDASYLFQMLETPLLEYRPPPPNRVFPDLLVHALIYPFGADMLQQKIIAGAIIFAITALMVGIFRGRMAFALYVTITVSCGFAFLNTGYHYSLPLTLLLYQLVRRTRADVPMLFLIVFSDVLVLMPLAMLFIQRQEREDLRRTLLVSFLAVIASVWYSEFSEAIADFAVALPIFCVATLVAYRLGMLRLFIVACCVAFPLGSIVGVVPARYGLPVASTMLLLLFDTRKPQFDWRYLAVPAAAVAVFLLTIDRTHHDQLQGDYRCLVEELARRQVDNVAVEYWTARPLYYAARQHGVPLTITQTDFLENDSDAFMAPYAFYGAPTQWAVKNLDTCRTYQTGPKSCNQAGAGKVTDHEAMCGVFELFHYEQPIPLHYSPPPGSKSESIRHHLHTYVGKAITRLQKLL